MANSPQAIKRARQSEKRRQHNASLKSGMRTAVKKVQKLVADKQKQAANEGLKVAVSLIDRTAKCNIIHKNTAARIKSRLNSAIKSLEA